MQKFYPRLRKSGSTVKIFTLKKFRLYGTLYILEMAGLWSKIGPYSTTVFNSASQDNSIILRVMQSDFES